MEYVRFPRTPHLIWLGAAAPRDDKVLSRDDAAELLSHPIVVEEKVDGANLGISLGEHGELRFQNRGSYLSWDSLHPQFKILPRWVGEHRIALTDTLRPNLILFGEWCYATHGVHYTRLPDWFLAFDVYDRAVGKFWSVERRNALAEKLRLATVPKLAHGRFNAATLRQLLGESRVTDGPVEGVYLRWDRAGFLQRRAKLVRAEFAQAIDEHWSSRPVRPNRLAITHGRLATH